MNAAADQTHHIVVSRRVFDMLGAARLRTANRRDGQPPVITVVEPDGSRTVVERWTR